MEKLKLIKPTIDYKDQVFQIVQEFAFDKFKLYGVGGLRRFFDNYEGWLQNLKNNENKDTVEAGCVTAKQFILVREADDKLLGFINTRLELNDELLVHGGHIGYAIRPSERNKHYATAQLFAVLKFYQDLGIEKVLLTCDKTNIGSAKTIQNCGGILENEIIDPVDGELTQRYWIDVNEGIEKGKNFFEGADFIIKL